ncbi:hypothetical protein OG920_13925 [Streptomyces europaeiscabiei]|uniref:hypothetical protein n=1 Tax=Streptomyces europaeiscabiei TaxID=146819 RepID=UPI0029A98936|nr:hypothetical protein [Streptomyces europaeiscabiei]MDX3616064.1 hypothetical protein [Streptomyces europaeiscabiei]
MFIEQVVVVESVEVLLGHCYRVRVKSCSDVGVELGAGVEAELPEEALPIRGEATVGEAEV